MRYGYWWGPDGPRPQALQALAAERVFHDADQYRRQFSALGVRLAAGDELVVVDLRRLRRLWSGP
ncbi:hypothetical protein [Lacticaseibacillus suihuaensis]